MKLTDSEQALLDGSQGRATRKAMEILVALGGGETGHFHEQTNEFVAEWKRYDAPIEAFFEPDVDHFDVVNRLADAESGFFKKTLNWLA